jgi:hypothetical protein
MMQYVENMLQHALACTSMHCRWATGWQPLNALPPTSAHLVQRGLFQNRVQHHHAVRACQRDAHCLLGVLQVRQQVTHATAAAAAATAGAFDMLAAARSM